MGPFPKQRRGLRREAAHPNRWSAQQIDDVVVSVLHTTTPADATHDRAVLIVHWPESAAAPDLVDEHLYRHPEWDDWRAVGLDWSLSPADESETGRPEAGGGEYVRWWRGATTQAAAIEAGTEWLRDPDGEGSRWPGGRGGSLLDSPVSVLPGPVRDHWRRAWRAGPSNWRDLF